MGFPEDTILYLVGVDILDVFMSSVRRERGCRASPFSANTKKILFCIKHGVFQTDTGLKQVQKIFCFHFFNMQLALFNSGMARACGWCYFHDLISKIACFIFGFFGGSQSIGAKHIKITFADRLPGPVAISFWTQRFLGRLRESTPWSLSVCFSHNSL